ncbi:K(+)-transporting ATPase subunit C [Chryseobacterium camelliae]|uniref:Potassium-transporting ATPase KdpC subunit n=1 Tax=Chryseobacterium camelliae TaxID=1265445 RepID=A0ABY7QLY1_9FLAO|nr:K(+)-transporting ATPase subunit C [Chryseobacterium camelliae]WBV60664.1 K(+)-transporting ATPase subunit C [Chryseobacterium camelliae]
MKQNILPAIRLTLLCAVFFSGIYTLFIFGIAQAALNNGKGEIIKSEKLLVKSEKTIDASHISPKTSYYYANIGQKFDKDEYFWSRPSAVDYNAAGAGGSNKGPSNPDYLKTVQERINHFMKHNPGIQKSEIPSDMVTASGGGLDPNISVQAAKIQIKRIAKIRQIDENKIRELITSNTEKPLLGLFGTEKINVLKLNIALDGLK